MTITQNILIGYGVLVVATIVYGLILCRKMAFGLWALSLLVGIALAIAGLWMGQPIIALGWFGLVVTLFLAEGFADNVLWKSRMTWYSRPHPVAKAKDRRSTNRQLREMRQRQQRLGLSPSPAKSKRR